MTGTEIGEFVARLTDDERVWLAGLVAGWLSDDHHVAARRLALGVLRKIEGVDKAVYVRKV